MRLRDYIECDIIVLFDCTVMTLSVAVFGQTISCYNYRRLHQWELCQEVITEFRNKSLFQYSEIRHTA